MLPRFCFPVVKQQVLLHLFSFLPAVAKHLVSNAPLSAETTSHPLLFSLLTTMSMLRYMKIEPAIISWKIPHGQRWRPLTEESCMFIPYSEMYPGFQIWGSSGPLFEKFGGPLQNFGGPAN